MVICADDFGLREDIDTSIDELCSWGKLSAVSCMVALERCSAQLCQSLRQHESRVDFGLHLCFTCEHSPNEKTLAPSAPNLASLVARAYSGFLKRAAISQEISAQFQLFTEKFGRAPDFIDGHLHVHQLPGIRAALIDFIRALPASQRPYVRNTAPAGAPASSLGSNWSKAGLIGRLGGKMKSLLTSAEIPTNSGFAGVYNFKQWRSYPAYFAQFVDCSTDPNGILVAHPGRSEEWRMQEFETLRDFLLQPGLPNRFQRN